MRVLQGFGELADLLAADLVEVGDPVMVRPGPPSARPEQSWRRGWSLRKIYPLRDRTARHSHGARVGRACATPDVVLDRLSSPRVLRALGAGFGQRGVTSPALPPDKDGDRGASRLRGTSFPPHAPSTSCRTFRMIRYPMTPKGKYTPAAAITTTRVPSVSSSHVPCSSERAEPLKTRGCKPQQGLGPAQFGENPGVDTTVRPRSTARRGYNTFRENPHACVGAQPDPGCLAFGVERAEF